MTLQVIVIGGGIIGLAVARELLVRRPGQKVLLLEKEPQIALHQTGHNSGVVHSGIYYPAGSEKAAGCLEGVRLLGEFCDKHKIERKRAGKVIVATYPEEFTGLEKLYQQGKANGIPGLRMISAGELREIEPAVTGLKALYLAEVSLVDFRRVSEALKSEFIAGGGTLQLHRKVVAIQSSEKEIRVKTEKDEYAGSYLINCGGLYCDRLAELAGCKVPVRIIPFRGEYFFLRPEIAGKIRGLVYPVADPKFPFLGVHLTPTLKGEVTAGPNAVLALAREGYRWQDICPAEVWDYFSYGGFWRMSAKHWRTGFFEVARSLVKFLYAASVRKFLPDLKSSDLFGRGSGVRAQAVNSKGELVHDFLYLEQPRASHILNAPSPAATASLVIAKRIVAGVLRAHIAGVLQDAC